jgi:hypothetical protein
LSRFLSNHAQFPCFSIQAILVAGGYTDASGPFADVELYSPDGTCQVKVRKQANIFQEGEFLSLQKVKYVDTLWHKA